MESTQLSGDLVEGYEELGVMWHSFHLLMIKSEMKKIIILYKVYFFLYVYFQLTCSPHGPHSAITLAKNKII